MTHDPGPNPYQYDPYTPPVTGEQYQHYQPGYSQQPDYQQQPSYDAQPGYPSQQPNQYAQPAYVQPGYTQYGYTTPNPPPQNGFGVAGMVLGIVSIPTMCCYIGPLVALVGGVFSGIGLSKANNGEATNKGMAIAGLVLSLVTILLCGLGAALGFTSILLEDGFDSR